MAKQQKQSEKEKEKEEEEDPFKVGTEVEVSFDDEGFRGSWYTATVIRSLSKRSNSTNNNRLFLEFLRLTSARDKNPLREYVNVILVRPVPPREHDRAFRVSEEVDAFHNDGWWEGVVISLLEGSRYSVFFRSSREQLEFHQSDLRLHREWVHGQWVPPFPFPEESSEVKPPAPAARPPSTTPAKG